MKKILFVFAHQDDEYPIISRIKYELLKRKEIICIYLTNGNGYNIDPERRNEESRKILSSLGVKDENIHFLGTEHGIDDGMLANLINEVYHFSMERIVNSIYRVFCLAWEGGHPDHDAAHLIALAIAKKLNILCETFQFSIYNGYGIPSYAFRTMFPLHENGKIIVRKIEKSEALKNSILCWKYKTQWKAWLGLFPEAFIKIAIIRNEILQTVSIDRTKERPHKNILYYEKKFKTRFEEFMKCTKDFRCKYLYR